MLSFAVTPCEERRCLALNSAATAMSRLAVFGVSLLASVAAISTIGLLQDEAHISLWSTPSTAQVSSSITSQIAVISHSQQGHANVVPHSLFTAADASLGGYPTVAPMRAASSSESIAPSSTTFWGFSAIGAAMVGVWFLSLGRGYQPAERYVAMMSTSGDKGGTSVMDKPAKTAESPETTVTISDSNPQPQAPAQKQAGNLVGTLQNTPFRLGHEARAWTNKMLGILSSPASGKGRRIVLDDAVLDELPGTGTSILVVGADTPVGKVLLRKLLLRGYTVRVLLSPQGADSAQRLDLPDTSKVDMVIGELNSHQDLMKSCSGMQKVIYCASLPGEDVDMQVRLQVDAAGPRALCRAMHDSRVAQGHASQPTLSSPAKIRIAEFKNMAKWGQVNVQQKAYTILPSKWATLVFDGKASMEAGETKTGVKTGVFTGEFQANREGVVDVSTDLDARQMEGLLTSEILLIKANGDEKSYNLGIKFDGKIYFTRFVAPKGWNSLRVPIDAFQNENGEGLPTSASGQGGKLILGWRASRTADRVSNTGRTSFRLELQFMKAIPASKETDLVLVSQSSASMNLRGGEGLMTVQMRGEDAVRNSGIAYTIIRPGPMTDSPSTGKVLMFDQSRRSGASISCTDVADVCIKVLKDKAACNKAFDVFNESPDRAESLYEIAAARMSNQQRVSEVLSVLDKHI